MKVNRLTLMTPYKLPITWQTWSDAAKFGVEIKPRPLWKGPRKVGGRGPSGALKPRPDLEHNNRLS
jgi:hypothetical protein